MSKDKLPTIERKKAADLTPDVDNANKGTERGLRALDDSIAEDGMGRSILLDRAGRVIAGNKTLERAVDRGIDDVLVIKTDGSQIVAVQRDDVDLDTEHGRRMAYRDNRIAQLDLDWDGAALLRSQQAGFDLLQVGFNQQELLEVLPQPEVNEEDALPDMSRADELQQVWQVARGDVWTIGDHRLMCGDSTDADDVARLMAGERADAVVTDPPYGIDFDTDYTRLTGRNYGGGKGVKNKTRLPVEGDSMPFDPTPLLSYATVILWGANCYPDKLHIGTFLVWDKRLPGKEKPFSDAEIGWVNKGHGAYIFQHFWDGVLRASEVGTQGLHPTQKPVALFDWCMRWVPDNAIVFDPYGGSGPVMAACHNSGRQCRMMEIHAPYCAVILQRMADLGVVGTLMNRD